MIEVQTVDVSSKKQLAAFIDFPHDLYKDDPNYVPELFIAQRDLLSPGKHPFFDHSEMKLFLALEGKTIRGRIAAILNNNSNQFKNANDGFFGFFDCVNDEAVSAPLFNAATQWLQSKKMSKLIGPVNPSTNETCGVLVDGFNRPPVAMMPYNKPYYNNLVEKAGLGKKVDLFAYTLDYRTVNEKSLRIQAALQERLQKRGITIRPINLKDFKNEVNKVRGIYNSAWDKNLGFVPMTENEFNYLAKDLKQIIDPGFCLVAEHEGKMIGFALGIPDINQVLINIKRGRLLPTGIFKLLFGLKKIDYIRVITLGVIEGYRKMGIEACFYAQIIAEGKRRKMGAEASWVLENNEMMNTAMRNIHAIHYKTYRIYEKAI